MKTREAALGQSSEDAVGAAGAGSLQQGRAHAAQKHFRPCRGVNRRVVQERGAWFRLGLQERKMLSAVERNLQPSKSL